MSSPYAVVSCTLDIHTIGDLSPRLYSRRRCEPREAARKGLSVGVQ